MFKELEREIHEVNSILEAQELTIEEYRLKTAMYKAFFFHRNDLAVKIQQQTIENLNNTIGEFDGFCYASWRANAIYRTLEDMVSQGIISKEEYNFCKE